MAIGSIFQLFEILAMLHILVPLNLRFSYEHILQLSSHVVGMLAAVYSPASGKGNLPR
jgi:hypothetical protein